VRRNGRRRGPYRAKTCSRSARQRRPRGRRNLHAGHRLPDSISRPQPRTIDNLRWRLGVATDAFGNVPLRDLERMSGELASWRAKLPERSRFAITAALRQALGAAVSWHYIGQNPAKLAGRNPQPAPRPVRAYTVAEVEVIAVELSPMYQPLPVSTSRQTPGFERST
jgi:hypothetical protein